MAIQVNTRIEESQWEKVVEGMPGMSNAERVSELVRQYLGFLASQRQLSEALGSMERMLAPSLQAVREHGVRGKGSELAEVLAQTAIDMGAVLLSHTDRLREEPEQSLPELEKLLVQRWARTTAQVLRAAALEPDSMCNHQAVVPEIRRIFEQVRLLSQATARAAPPASPTSNP